MLASSSAMQKGEFLLFWVQSAENIENLAELQKNCLILAKYILTVIYLAKKACLPYISCAYDSVMV